MVAISEKNPFDTVARSLGYQNAFEFTRIELKHQLAQKMTYFQSRTDRYEQKYGMLLNEFMNRVADRNDSALKRFGILEKEDDLMDWESSDHSFRFYQQQLDTLTDGDSTH